MLSSKGVSARALAAFAVAMLVVAPPFLTTGASTVASGTYNLGTAYNSETKIVADSGGGLYASYSGLSANDVYYVQVAHSTDGGASWAQVPGIPAGPFSSRSALAMTPTGSLGVVWTEGVTDLSQIYFSMYKDGSWSQKVVLSDSKYYSGYPAIASDSRGLFHVVWYGFDGTTYQIYYSEGNGTAWSAPTDLSARKQDSLNPSIAIDPADNVYVAWYAAVVHNYQVLFTYYSGSWSRTVPLTADTINSANPALAIQPDGRASLVWVSAVDQVDQVFTMTGSLGAWGPKHQLTNATQYASNPTQAFAPNGTEYVFWTQGNGLYGCAFVSACSPRAVYTDGFNSFPIAGSDPGGNGNIALMWTHAPSTTGVGNSVLFVSFGPRHPAASALYGLLDLLVVVAFLALFLVAGRNGFHASVQRLPQPGPGNSRSG